MIPNIDLDRFELVLDRQYVKYYAVNRTDCLITPFGVTGRPLTLAEAKTELKRVITSDRKHKYRIEEAKLHISFFAGYQHLSPAFDNDPNVVGRDNV